MNNNFDVSVSFANEPGVRQKKNNKKEYLLDFHFDCLIFQGRAALSYGATGSQGPL